MKSILLITILMMSVISCNRVQALKSSQYHMNCESTGNSVVIRCENREVICYRILASAVSCIFKEK